ncbi:amidohydrolase family protein [Mucilaginibacter sp.]|jgi:cytosine/adenosine deaminase-related metal-dependent hydrolase|uniref:amidohydrolase family protein n=1 Tax=Mucilaginibacter sp. TaxID=1882438 RepID=UPI0035699477
MILNNVCIADSDKKVNIRISRGKIAQISDAPLTDENCPQLMFINAIIFPGLINSHDHLDFNLFPKLGNKTYPSYTEWGKHIHKTYADEIAAILKIPKELRERWGMYKNLLCGVTTVVNHGERSGMRNALINIFEKPQSIHSIQFEKEWKKKLNNPLQINKPAVIHIGEGTNAAARNEVNKLLKWNLLNRKLIGIHGVALTPTQAKSFKAIVWCPQSNYFLLDATAKANHLKKFTQILFGTDSTLTGSWDIWDHIRMARKTQMLTDEELYQSLTTKAAVVWQLNTGNIQEGFDADLIIARAKTSTPGLTSFYDTRPDDILLVMHRGNIRLFDESIYHQLDGNNLYNFNKIHIGNSIKYVQGDITGLIAQIKQYKPDADIPVYISSEPAA